MTYEKNLSAWLRDNPLSVISKPALLEILHKTRSEVYTIECITGAWRKSRCWPINRKFEVITNDVSDDVLDKPEIRSMNTSGRLRTLTKKAEGIIRELNAEDRDAVYEVLDFAIQKVTKYQDIMPRANTLMKLRNGKVRREKRAKSRKIGEARVLTYKHVNEGLQKLEDDEAE